MSELVNARPEDIRKLAVALGAYQREVMAATKKVQSALGSAHWHDGQKDKFEARYREHAKNIDRFMSGEVDQMIKGLNSLAGKLAEIQGMRM